MFEAIQNFTKNIENYHIEEKSYHMKVRPEFITHDEICYHIESLVALEVHSDIGVQEFTFYREDLEEIIGEELEVDLDDFIDFDSVEPAYEEAILHMKETLKLLNRSA